MNSPLIFISPESIFKTGSKINRPDMLSFLPGAISGLSSLSRFGYKVCFLGVNTFEKKFSGKKVLDAYYSLASTILASEGVVFSKIIYADKKTDLLESILLAVAKEKKSSNENTLLIGNCTEIKKISKKTGWKALSINNKSDKSWKNLTKKLIFSSRTAKTERKTAETDISLKLDLDGNGKSKINTGLPFFDHMLENFSKHSGFDITLSVKGDLEVDEHHTVEDVAIVLGQTFNEALGNKRGIGRYGFYLPMDESIAQCAVDLSGRAFTVFNATFKREKIKDLPTELVKHFFESFAINAKINLNLSVQGENEHHMIEALFKALAKSLYQAVKRNPDKIYTLDSTKNTLS
jgi:imidazoleglycerol-phosphate dehydratase/histidinol-phosphatase